MGLIALAKIADVLMMWHVGFGDESGSGDHLVQNSAPYLNNVMGLRQVDAAGTHLFPDVADGVETDRLSAAGRILQQHIDTLQQYLRILEVNVHLVFAESGPQIELGTVGFDKGS